MRENPVEAVGRRRAGWTTGGIARPKHEVIDDELRASFKEISQRRFPSIRLETVILSDWNPRQFLPPLRQFVAAPRQFLLRLKQFQSGCKPLFTCSGHMFNH